MTECSCDVIIPTWKGERYIPELVTALRAQTCAPKKIIVVDSSSPDRSVEFAKKLGCEVLVIPQAEFNHGATRNLAASLGASPILVFMTQDAKPDHPKYLENLLKVFENPHVSGAYARQIPYPDAHPPEVFARSFNYPDQDELRGKDSVRDRGIRAFFFSNVASAIRRSTFERLGGFPGQLPMNEDMVFCARLIQENALVAYVSNAIVCHSHNYSLVQQARRYFDIGAFFADQGHLLAGGKTGGEGSRFAVGQILWLLKNKYWLWALRAPIEILTKWISFHAGRRYRFLPAWVVYRWAMHLAYYRCKHK